MLVNLKTILSGAREGGYAVGLFNCVTLELYLIHISSSSAGPPAASNSARYCSQPVSTSSWPPSIWDR